MANNYLSFSFAVPLPKEASEYAVSLFEAWDHVVTEDEDQVDPALRTIVEELGAEEDGTSMSVETSIEDDGTLCIWAEEFGNVEGVVKVLQWVLFKFGLDMKIGFCWAETCSKPRLNEFSGGAVAFTSGDATWLNTHQ